MINKKTLLIGSGLTIGVMFLLKYLTSTEIISCGDDPHLNCYFFFQRLVALGLGLVPLFVFSSMMYFVKESTFNLWLKLVYVYLFVLILVISISSVESGGYVSFPSDLLIALELIALVFIIASIILIAWKYIASLPKY